MTEPTLKQKTAKGLFWGGFSNGLQQLIGLGFGIYFARVLSQDDYGLVAMLAIFTGIASTIINCGFSTALVNKQDATHEDYNAVFWFTFFAGLILYVILFFSAPLIARFYEEPVLVKLSRVVFISFFLSGLGTVSQTVLLKRLMVKQQAIIDTTSLLISCTLGFIMVVNGYAYWAIAIQTVLFISLSALLRLFIAPWKPTLNFNFSPLKQMYSFSIKLFLTNIFTQINAYMLTVVLGKFFGKANLGQYDRGQKWVGMGNMFISGMINSVTQPVLAQINEDKNRQIGVLRKLIRFGAFISFPLMLGLAFVGKEFILIAIGEKWLPSVPVLQLFCIWGAAGFLVTLFMNLIFTHGKSGIYMNVTIVIGLLQIAMLFCLFQFGFGVIPMLAGYIGTSFIGLFIWYFYVWKLIGLRLKDVLKDTLPYLGIVLFCFGITWLITRNIQNLYLLLILKIIISGILYIFVLRMSNSVMFKESVEFLTNYQLRITKKDNQKIIKRFFGILFIIGFFLLFFCENLAAQDSIPPVLEDTDAILQETGGLHQFIKTRFIEGSALFMSSIALSMIVGLAFCLERIIYLNLIQINTDKFLSEIETFLEKKNIDGAQALARNTRGPVASICYQAVLRIDKSVEVIDKSITSFGSVQTGLLEKNLSWITLFIAIAPALGFLGTVIGMIQAFDNIQQYGDISPTIIAGGMKVALITTVAGLIVAIILQLFYNYILNKVEGIVNDMEDDSIKILDLIIKYK